VEHLEKAVPFSFQGNEVRVLLVHGFTGSPAEMRELGEYLHEREGYTIRCDLLPGHGTSVADLGRTTWHDWYQTALKGYRELSEGGHPVHVVGLSMGGLVSLHLATHHKPKSLTALSAPIQLKNWKISLTPIIRHFVTGFPKPGGFEDIKDPKAREGFVGYQQDPPAGVHSLLQLMDHVRDDLSEITSPTLLMHAVEDHRVPYECLELIQKGIGSSASVKTITLEDCYHVITVDQEKDKVFQATLEHIQAHI
jgi:carboxylesterase